MSLSRSGKKWTEEELNYLQDKWGVMTLEGIAKKLKRTEVAVKLKAQRIGLGDPRTHLNGITMSELSKALNIHYGIVRNWRDKYGLPVRQVRLVKKPVWVISYDDFWKWAEKNKHMIDFSRVERLALGPEPKWVAEKRKADELTKLHKPQPHNTPWSDDDIAKLKWMLKQFRYTYPEISKELGRSHGAIKRKILDLGIKERPVPLKNHNKYTEKEVDKLVKLAKKGYCFDVIAEKLGNGRSAIGVRGKMERMGYKFKNGVPYKESV